MGCASAECDCPVLSPPRPSVLVLAGVEVVFLPVAAVFWSKYETKVDNADIFSCCHEIKDFFWSPTPS